MSAIRLKQVDIVFPNGRNPVKKFNLDIAEGELVVLAGPATSGKSVLIKLIAGLEAPTGGEILFNGDPVSRLSAQERETFIISEDQSLYPDLTVYENLAIGLKLKRMDPERIDQRIRDMGEMLGLLPILDSDVSLLTEEQAHRVTLARYGVRNPRVLLIDQPYTQLDSGVRERLLQDIIKLNQHLGITIIYATGNIRDARKLPCRICVINRGVMQQTGTWDELLRRPETPFVTGYLSERLINYIEVSLEKGSAGIWARLAGQSLKVPDSIVQRFGLNNHLGEVCLLGIHAEDVAISRTPGIHALKGLVFSKEVLEDVIVWSAKTEGQHLISSNFDKEIRLNEDVYLNFSMDEATFQFR